MTDGDAVAAQNFEYKITNILDKPTESLFGYISVLVSLLPSSSPRNLILIFLHSRARSRPTDTSRCRMTSMASGRWRHTSKARSFTVVTLTFSPPTCVSCPPRNH